MEKIKHKLKIDQKYGRLEKIQNFVYEKKQRNHLKYDKNSQINVKAAAVPKGTMSIMLNIIEKKKEEHLKNNEIVAMKGRFKLKWKTIQWLFDNKKQVVEQLTDTKKGTSVIRKLIKSDSYMVQKDRFSDLMQFMGLGGDLGLIQKLFTVLGANSQGQVDFRELVMGVELFKENPVEHKVKTFFALAEQNTITVEEIHNILKVSVVIESDQFRLKRILTGLYKVLGGNKKMDKWVIYQQAIKNLVFCNIFRDAVNSVTKVDKLIENDLEDPQFHAICSSQMDQNEGTHFKLMDKLTQIVAENENVQYQNKIRMLQLKSIGIDYYKNFQITDTQTTHNITHNHKSFKFNSATKQ